ncbi:MAG: C39 family peptidase [Chloroflexota bacterium]
MKVPRFSRLRWLGIPVLALVASGLPGYIPAQAGPVFLPGFPLLRQQRPLTCEASAASMGTRARIGESRLMAMMSRNPNPNLGFRGNPDGFQGQTLVDYGVYAKPLHQALLRFGYQSDVIDYGSDWLLRSYLNRGWPVVAWMTYQLQHAVPRLAEANGVQFFLVPHEHAILIVGYDNASILANDPWTAQLVRYGWKSFNRSWGLFGNMALALQPCAAPQPVIDLRVLRPTPPEVTWVWKRPIGAVRFRLTLTASGSRHRLLYLANQTDNRFTYVGTRPGKGYLLSVASVSGCGSVAPGYGAWYWTSPATPTPTPSPTPSPTPLVEGTVSPTSAPTEIPTAAVPPAASITPTSNP